MWSRHENTYFEIFQTLLWYARGPSKWLRTKWEGEQAVLKEFPDATIFRACEMYGYGDHFTQ